MEYDVAISFAGEDRAIAQKLAKLLYKCQFVVFYDDYEQARLLGKTLTEHFVDVYMNRARFCVVLVSASYKKKRWDRLEWKAIQARAWSRPDDEYILPIRLDDTDLPGLLPTIGYLDLRKDSVAKIARRIEAKVRDHANIDAAIRRSLSLYREHLFDEALEEISDPLFDDEVEALRIRADVLGGKGDYKGAIVALEGIEARLPDDFVSQFLLGIFNFRISKFAESVVHYERAEAIAPNHPTIASDLPQARELAEKEIAIR